MLMLTDGLRPTAQRITTFLAVSYVSVKSHTHLKPQCRCRARLFRL